MVIDNTGAQVTDLNLPEALTTLTLNAADEPEPLANELSNAGRIIIEFDSFADGRGLSLAVLLRERFAYKGKLQASGDIIADLCQYLVRCGFDEINLRADQSREDACENLSTYDVHYQASVIDPQAIYHRHTRTAEHAT